MRALDVVQIFCVILSGICSAVTADGGAKVNLSSFKKHSFALLSPEIAASQANAAQATENSSATTVAVPSSVASATACNSPAVHREWRALSNAEKAAYVKAQKCLFQLPSKSGLSGPTNRVEDLQAVHQQLTSSIHNVGQFLPWHRYYLHVFEQMMRNECGYAGPMTWWDETKDAGNFHSAPMFKNAYFGSAPPITDDGQGTCITNGAFGNTMLSIGPGQSDTTHCLSRAVDESLSQAITKSFVNTCNSYKNYTSMWNCVFFGPHAYGHDAIGAVMSDVDTSPGDPIFFLHHGFIDRNWYAWQNINTKRRLYQVNGYTTQSEPDTGWVETSLDYTLTSLNLGPDAHVRDVMDTKGSYLCYTYDY